MTKKLYSAVLAGTAALAVGLGATSANAATTSANATAEIVQAITIVEDDVLNFGVIVPAGAASTVDITAGGTVTCGAGLTCSGSAVPGAFTATGSDGYDVDISVDASTSLTSGANSMTVNNLAPSAATATLTGGTTTFTVGGTLNVGANQVAGVYSGNYNVSVDYQ